MSRVIREVYGTSLDHPWMPGFLPPPPPPPCQSIRGFPLNIPGSSMDAWLPTPLASYPLVRVSMDSLDTLDHPWMPGGFPGYSEHPWIIHGCLASYPPVIVSTDSLDTLNIPGSSMDAWLHTPPCQSIRGFPDIPGSSMDAWLPTPPPCQSIRGFPGYSEHPWIIHGCLASYPPFLSQTCC